MPASARTPPSPAPASAAPASAEPASGIGTHTASDVAVQGALCISPGAHTVHALHSRSLVGVGAADSCSPASHAVHAAQLAAPISDQLPAAQAMHAVAPVPSAEYVPAGHALHA